MNGIALMFPGQGSQFIGMGHTFYKEFPYIRNLYEEASDYSHINIKKLCFEGPKEKMNLTEYTQPLILTVSVAAFQVYMHEIGIAPQVALGHSLGEISALVSANAISFTDALLLCRERGRVMQRSMGSNKGLMANIIGLDINYVQDVCKKISDESCHDVVISNYNSDSNLVISGEYQLIDYICQKLKNKGGKIKVLEVSAAFHSPYMNNGAIEFEQELLQYKFNDFKWGVLSNIDASLYQTPDKIVKNLVLQMKLPVQWNSCIKKLKELNITSAVELSARSILAKFSTEVTNTLVIYPFQNLQHVKHLKANEEYSSKCSMTEQSSLNFIKKCLTTAVSIKNRREQMDGYENEVIIPYRRIEHLFQTIASEKRTLTDVEFLFIYRCLEDIFNFKNITEHEKAIWMDWLDSSKTSIAITKTNSKGGAVSCTSRNVTK